jgi:hypothetical protein
MSKNIEVLTVDSNVPLPSGRAEPMELPLSTLEVGESFGGIPVDRRNSVATRMTRVGKKENKKFTLRLQPDNTIRVWRTE